MNKKQTKRAVSTANGSDELRLIPLSEIEPTTDNVRKKTDPKKFAELVKSIKAKGVLQALLLRPTKAANGAAKYEIIAGERRFRAATEAGLSEVPAYVKPMSDQDALSAGLMENLLREDIHPLDEADGFLRFQHELKLDVRATAQRVAKDSRYVARRLSLTNLIAEAREDFRKERITLAHALEISRLDPEIQSVALLACYEVRTVPSNDEGGIDYVADKERPAHSVQHLQEWLRRNVHLNLAQTPFQLDDPRLREDGLTCLACPQRSGFNKTLFADIQEADVCLNPLCFQAKRERFVELGKTALAEKTGKPTVCISSRYDAGKEEGILSLGTYQVLAKKADRCQHAVQAIYVDGAAIGQVKWICFEPACKDHLGRVRSTQATPVNGSLSTGSTEARHARRQELFSIKVDEVVRKRIFGEAIKTFSWPLDRLHLNEAAKEFFRRIPSDDQKTICEVFGWNEETASKLRFDDEAVLRELAKLDDDRLAQFLMLCSFAHYGANQHKNRQMNQSLVVALSEARGVNHLLIDAEVRLELCPKRYRDAHQAYLKAVQDGRQAEKPVVY